METIASNPKFKKSAHALALLPSKQSLELTDFDRKLINVLLKTSIELGSPEHELPGYRGKFYRMPQARIGQLMGLPMMFDYEHLRGAMEKLQSIKLRMESPSEADNEIDGAPPSKLLGSLVLLPTVVHEKKSERLVGDGSLMSWWQFNESLEPYLLDPRRYAILRIESITSMKRSASIALYEICARFATSPTHSTGFKPLDWWVQALTGHLVTGAKRSVTYSEFKYFSRDILVPSVKEVNEMTELDVKVELKKLGKRVTELRFVVTNKPVKLRRSTTPSAPAGGGDEQVGKMTEMDVLRLKAVSLKVTDKFFTEICEVHPLELVEQAVYALDAAISRHEGNTQASPIRSSNAYIKAVIKNKLEEQQSPQMSMPLAPAKQQPEPQEPSLPAPAPVPAKPRLPVEADADEQDPFAVLSADQLDELVEATIERLEKQMAGNPQSRLFFARTAKDLRERNLVGLARAQLCKQLDLMGAKK